MGLKNKISPGEIYFLTMTVVDWVDVFTRPKYREIMVESLNYCVQNKGLIIHAWVLMSNHVHMVAQASTGLSLSDILRDLKKFTSKKIVAAIQEVGESRSDWMLYRFAFSGKFDSKIKDYRFWKEGNEPKECFSFPFIKQKIDYIHNNPVRAQLVLEPQHYLHSSALDYCGQKGLVPVEPAW